MGLFLSAPRSVNLFAHRWGGSHNMDGMSSNMTDVHVLDPTKRWECPSCGAQHVTREPRPHTPMHPCRAQKGLLVPFVEVHGTELAKHSVRHVPVEREDYVADEVGVAHDGEGRAVQAVRTERADGSYDCHVFAPTASLETEQ